MKRLDAKNLERLFEALRDAGYTVIGPHIRDQAIVYEEIASARELPLGWTEEQEAGRYRLKPRQDRAYFGFASSPQSWKPFLFPPRERLFQAVKDPQRGMRIVPEPAHGRKLAFLGVRACDVAAIAVQDRVFTEGNAVETGYQARRRDALLVAVQCTASSPTCFCSSMNTGPEVRGGYDLVLTEAVAAREHYFLLDAGSARGEAIVKRLARNGGLSAASEALAAEAGARTQQAAQAQRRKIDGRGAKDLLFANFEHPRWEQVAARCLNCANCTLVCPTCFCSTVEDTTDLTGDHAERWRRWDSCFTVDHSYIHGGALRASAKSRYRQWLTHKLSSWWDQFGTSGCVGCGRCITWCPVGIDITEEVEAIRHAEIHQNPA
jgi:ferredoxin